MASIQGGQPLSDCIFHNHRFSCQTAFLGRKKFGNDIDIFYDIIVGLLLFCVTCLEALVISPFSTIRTRIAQYDNIWRHCGNIKKLWLLLPYAIIYTLGTCRYLVQVVRYGWGFTDETSVPVFLLKITRMEAIQDNIGFLVPAIIFFCLHPAGYILYMHQQLRVIGKCLRGRSHYIR